MLETITALLTVGGSLMGLSKDATAAAQNIKGLIDKPGGDNEGAKRLASDLLNHLLRLQMQQLALQDALRNLQEEQRRIDRFQAEAVRYVLTQTEQGSFLYELDPDHANGEPAHCICATCYEKRIKSILQPVAHNTLTCGVCSGRFYRPDGRGSGIMIGRVSRRDTDGFI